MTAESTRIPLPLHTFRFELSFKPDAPFQRPAGQPIGAFAECTGLEATMEPKVIRAGGHNYGAKQRVGPVNFATVVLKRGISRGGQLFQWFHRVATVEHGSRCDVLITLNPPAGDGAGIVWTLERAMPIKFKAADFNAKATEVGVEELHLAHEGLLFAIGEAPKGGT